jgi:16S rRNA (adenine1518-N6/adenine1519-N6)-dimethyltransferase
VSPTSRSPGEGPAGPLRLTPGALRALAARHGIRPKKSLGQHFLIEPTLARRIVELADVGPDDQVVEVGAGLGSLTGALAATGARVVALEIDRSLVPAVQEAVVGADNVRIEVGDALSVDWRAVLGRGHGWKMVANLPYNVAVPVVMRVLESEPSITRLLVMVQREVGERLAAKPGDTEFGAVSLRVAYRATAQVVRTVPRTVFWPAPNVDSVLVSMVRHPPPVEADEANLWALIREAFAQRRKTIRSALLRLGLDPERAAETLRDCGVEPMRRPEELGLREFACLANGIGSR